VWYAQLFEALPLQEGAFLQRAVGSALTEINWDKALFVLLGSITPTNRLSQRNAGIEFNPDASQRSRPLL
jgi:hypothetical protein